MGLLKDLIAAAPGLDTPVREVVTGPHYSMVTAAGSGVAANPMPLPADPGSEPGTVSDTYRQRPLADLAALAVYHDRARAALGIAALNAAFASGHPEARPRSLAIPRAGGKTVAVIGEFAFIEDLKRVAARVITVTAGPEQVANPERTENLEPAPGAAGLLEEADIAIIHGAAIVDGSLERWLELTRHCYTVVYGPSTPPSPVLFEYGADQLVGIRITLQDAAARWIREGRQDLLACPGISPLVIARDR